MRRALQNALQRATAADGNAFHDSTFCCTQVRNPKE
jgi:hypothetical protein